VSDMVVRLLGPPEIERHGAIVDGPRGRKVWAVIAYLVLAEQRVPRARLAALMFAGADDPLGALRWALAQVRRVLGLAGALRGDPLELNLPSSVQVDVLCLLEGHGDPGLVRGELLEGADPDAGEAFDAWLLVERRRLAGVCEGVLREAALGSLAAGVPLEGAGFASRALSLSPFDESLHELLVRCLARAGQFGAARHQASACEVLFRRELGRSPDPRVRRAAEEGGSTGPPPSGDRSAAIGQLEAGMAALAAGAAEPGVACMRMACAEAYACGEPELLARTLSELGSALVHAVRGRDEEGAALLHEALMISEQTGDREMAGRVCRELGYVDVQAGRGTSAGRWLERSTQLALTDGERAAVLGVRGMALSDRAHYVPAVALLSESVSAAERCGAIRQTAWSLALLGRTMLLCGDLPSATAALDRSLALVEQDGWIAFRPLPEALRGEVALRGGELEQASELLHDAFALGCRLGDPCWEAFAGRAIGLLHAARGELTAALECLRDATRRAIRVCDPYVWVHAHSLEALSGLAVSCQADDAAALVADLERIAARSGMREMVVRAALHRAALGDPAGVEAARPLAEAIDSPALQAAFAALA
jgi:DNA-binding SARP family transcriptional activator